MLMNVYTYKLEAMHPSIRAYLTVYTRLSINKQTTFDVFRQHQLVIGSKHNYYACIQIYMKEP